MASYFYTYDSNLGDRNKYTSTVKTTFGTKRYFSSLDTEVYFGQTQIDEMFMINFMIEEPKLPIYGYNSFYANRVVSGRRTINGTFAINFTNPLYLLKILNKIDNSVLSNDYESIVYRCEGDDSTGLGIGNSSIFEKQFDITLSYGHGYSKDKQTYNSCYQTLVGVQIVDYKQALDIEGNPILDMYSFIAKDIRYDEKLENTKPVKEESVPDDKFDIGPEYIIANSYIPGDLENLIIQCTNTNVDGFILEPYFYCENDRYYIDLAISTVNNNTETFRNVILTITDSSKGVNVSCKLKDIKCGTRSTYEFKDNEVDKAILLYAQYQSNKAYKANCNIEFTAQLDNKNQTLEYDTVLISDVEDVDTPY